MNRGAGRRSIFVDDRDRVEFGRVLGEACERSGIEVHAYCLMANHFHLLVRCPEGGLSEALQWLSAVYTRRFNQRLGSDGPIMRGRFRSKEIDSDSYLLAVARYIHLNPVPVLGGVPLDRYRWSSLRTYLGHRHAPAWMRTDTLLGYFDGSRAAFARHLIGGLDDVAALASLAEFALDEIVDDAPAGPKLARTVAVLAAERLGIDDAELTSGLGYASDRLARQARSRARVRASSDPSVGEAVDRLLAGTAHSAPDVNGIAAAS